MSGYLKLARRIRARREESRSRLASEAVTDKQTIRQNRPVHLNSEGSKLEAVGFEPKERCGKIIWQKPDKSFWVSQEMALHLLESKSIEEDQRA